nr:MAG TPA: hypothetical protein [Caudoviricetes sp.]
MTLLSRSSDHLTHELTSRLWLRVERQGILTCPRNLRTHRRPHNPYTGFHIFHRQDVRQQNQHGNVLVFLLLYAA